MSLPTGFLDELRGRTSLAQVVARKVSWDMRKTNTAKGDFWAPCPFHQEKTASFHVDDRKGFYYCFGCHAKGDALTFLRESENMSFLEAVEVLAREAGMPMPARDPAARARDEAGRGLSEVLEEAARFYARALRGAAGAAARSYLEGRGRGPECWERFGLGYAPGGGAPLLAHLRGRGLDEEAIIAAGLAARPEAGGSVYERMRDRIVFPIRDGRGRCIGFGGRAMSSDAQAKYLNSPQTALFDKGRSLYNIAPARAAAGGGQTLVVSEGYMDVIALSEAGFEAAVAPLGTAITETQLRMLWRISPEPVIALDGDTAGLRAAHRLIDLALPLIEAGQGLRFALLPAGQDPDDLIRAAGAGAMAAVLDGARPMVDLLWKRETEGQVFDSPERRAALDARLRKLVATIGDPSIREHTRAALREFRADLFGSGMRRQGFGGRNGNGTRTGFRDRTGGGNPGWAPAPGPASDSARGSALAMAAAAAASARHEERLREAVIVAICVTTPPVVARFEAELEGLTLSDPEASRLLEAVLAELRASPGHDGPTLMRALEDRLGGDPLGALLRLGHVRNSPALRAPGDLARAALGLGEELAKLNAGRAARAELEEAMEDFRTGADERITWRLGRAVESRERAARGSFAEEGADYTTAPNGLQLNRQEKGNFDDLVGSISYDRARGRRL
ncbi:MAG: DNA primase [Rhodobacteraceae bacterium]|nr:DNA primase [Paracoccaceae bacterium]